MDKKVLAACAFVASMFMSFPVHSDDDMNAWITDSVGDIDMEANDGSLDMGNGVSVGQDTISPKEEDSSQGEMVDQALGAYGDDDDLQQLNDDASRDLRGTDTYDTNHSKAFDIAVDSHQTESGKQFIDSYGCTIRRNPANEMVYEPSAPSGSKIKNREITLDEKTCQPEYVDRFGAKCKLVGDSAECSDQDNDKTVRSEFDPKLVDYRTYTQMKGNQDRSDTLQNQYELWYKPRDNVGGNNSNDFLETFLNIDLSNVDDPRDVSIKITHGRTARFGNNVSCSGSRCVSTINDVTINETPKNYRSAPKGWRDAIVGVNGSVDWGYASSGKGELAITATMRGQLYELRKASDRERLSIYKVEVINNSSLNVTKGKGDYKQCGQTVDPPFLGEICDDYETLELTPSVARTELDPLWEEDDQANVCWEAGIRSKCEIDTQLKRDEVNEMVSMEGVNEQLLQMTSDCDEKVVDREKSEQLTYTERKQCTKPLDTTYEGCTLEREYWVIEERHEGAGEGEIVRYEDKAPLEGSDRCQAMWEEINSGSSSCQYTYDFELLDNWTEKGDEACTHTGYSEVCVPKNEVPGKVVIDEMVCPPSSQEKCDTYTDDSGQEKEVCFSESDVEGTCGEIESDSNCRLKESNCIATKDSAFGSACTEEEFIYECSYTDVYSEKTQETVYQCGDETELYCLDGSCVERGEDSKDDGFGEAAAMLSAVNMMEEDMQCEDPNNPETCRFFSGEHKVCRKGKGGFDKIWDCCDVGGGDQIEGEDMIKQSLQAAGQGDAIPSMGTEQIKALVTFLVPCKDQEYELFLAKEKYAEHYIGSECGAEIDLGLDTICIRTDKHYCAWEGPVGRIFSEEGYKQLGRDFGSPGNPNCDGLSLTEMENINWNEIDTSEWEKIMKVSDAMPPTTGESPDPDSATEGLRPNPGEVPMN